MHLIESISNEMECVPVVHEVAAGIAAEYYNETSNNGKAFALVTAGPGLTNIVTAMAGAFLESRELLVIGGQVKSSDLSRGDVRQRGIQEIDGVNISKPICKNAILIDRPICFAEFKKLVFESKLNRPGPVFLEYPLDVQAQDFIDECNIDELGQNNVQRYLSNSSDVKEINELFLKSKRPVILLGGGLKRDCTEQVMHLLAAKKIPVCTTWNAADRIDASEYVYCGRPNTWGQRSANLIIQQADLLLALGTRLGMQQTGFNWQEFVPNGKIVQVDLDATELNKGHPKVEYKICSDANLFLNNLVSKHLGDHSEWLAYCRSIRDLVPLVENINSTRAGYLSPYQFIDEVSDVCSKTDVIIPCSSGGAFTTAMQAFRQKIGQKIVTNKGLAAMGYGLSGAIGAALANRASRVILIEGDGGFSQNLQELGTAKINDLNMKIFIFDDSGYASIRMTQKNYFAGKYVGCDTSTGLGLPNWNKLFDVWDIPVCTLTSSIKNDKAFLELFNSVGLAAFIVKIDPEQTYFPKISSRVTDSGSMESNPLHRMSPELDEVTLSKVSRYISD
jgi:acetolactate synthase-1/2/3 large subunit